MICVVLSVYYCVRTFNILLCSLVLVSLAFSQFIVCSASVIIDKYDVFAFKTFIELKQ